MFDWIGDLIDSVVGAIQDGFEWIGEVLLGQIWNTMMQWLYETVYTAVADFFALMGNMGADMLGYFCRWADYAIKDADLDERYPTADYVRLIVYRS